MTSSTIFAVRQHTGERDHVHSFRQTPVLFRHHCRHHYHLSSASWFSFFLSLSSSCTPDISLHFPVPPGWNPMHLPFSLPIHILVLHFCPPPFLSRLFFAPNPKPSATSKSPLGLPLLLLSSSSTRLICARNSAPKYRSPSLWSYCFLSSGIACSCLHIRTL